MQPVIYYRQVRQSCIYNMEFSAYYPLN